MPERAGNILWPGLVSPISATYTCSHGISPGCAVVTCNPQDASRLASSGDLVLADGVCTIRIPRCKLQQIRAVWNESGTVWVLEIVDRRWMWRDCGGILEGVYNVPDAAGDVTRPPPDSEPVLRPKTIYIPWTQRTPRQLAELCLRALGEQRFAINLPEIIYPLPAIDWDHVSPAQALSSLVEAYGYRIVYRLDTDSVLITPAGVGADLPDGSIKKESPSIKGHARPDSITLVGAPVVFQGQFYLEAVGEEWDGSIRPIEELSYAPEEQAQRHLVRVEPSNVTAGDVFTCEIGGIECTFTATASTVANVCTGLAAAINLQFGLHDVTATDNTTHITLTGNARGDGFAVVTDATNASILEWEITQVGKLLGRRWCNEFGPFYDVQETDRLTYAEAKALADKSVYKWYRCVNRDSSGIDGVPHQVPGRFSLKRIQQAVLLQEMVEQIQPPRSDQMVMGPDGQDRAATFYDGLFRRKPAKCYGVYTQPFGGGMVYEYAPDETLPEQEVLVPFSLVPERWLVQFSDYVRIYSPITDQTRPGEIVLQTGYQVRDPDTNQVERLVLQVQTSGPRLGTPTLVIRQEDVELFVVGGYDGATHTLVSHLSNADEAFARARYYLGQQLARLGAIAGLEREYNGLMPIWCDGSIQQVTWRIDLTSGAETQASKDSEHNLYVPTYPERLRAEYLWPLSRGNKQPDPRPKVPDHYELGKHK